MRSISINIIYIFTSLKFAALRHLPSHEEFFRFFGFANQEENLQNYYTYIQPNLDAKTKDFWENRSFLRGPKIEYFTRNLYNYGAMGYFIRFLHQLCEWFAEHPKKLLLETDLEKRKKLFEDEFSPFFRSYVDPFYQSHADYFI
jgi:S-adenosylmethionine-diacylglycerol 3-amino-3-carboxypropyl transferase